VPCRGVITVIRGFSNKYKGGTARNLFLNNDIQPQQETIKKNNDSCYFNLTKTKNV
jgi:hypothetical protein